MHSGIGAATALHVHLSAKEICGGLEQAALNGFGIILFLPTAVSAAVKLQNQLESFCMDVHLD